MINITEQVKVARKFLCDGSKKAASNLKPVFNINIRQQKNNKPFEQSGSC